MKIFVSYRSVDRVKVDTFISDLNNMGHEVWFDQNIYGGQKWWETILERIRRCDLLIFALTPEALKSYPCLLEIQYADALRRGIIPVQLTKTDYHRLPTILQTRQIVDYTVPDKNAFINLTRAIANLPAQLDLPDPLPDPPAVPISPLSDTANNIKNPNLSAGLQEAILNELEKYIDDPELGQQAIDLLGEFSSHPDLRHAIGLKIDALLRGHRNSQSPNDILLASLRERIQSDAIGDDQNIVDLLVPYLNDATYSSQARFLLEELSRRSNLQPATGIRIKKLLAPSPEPTLNDPQQRPPLPAEARSAFDSLMQESSKLIEPHMQSMLQESDLDKVKEEETLLQVQVTFKSFSGMTSIWAAIGTALIFAPVAPLIAAGAYFWRHYGILSITKRSLLFTVNKSTIAFPFAEIGTLSLNGNWIKLVDQRAEDNDLTFKPSSDQLQPSDLFNSINYIRYSNETRHE